MKVMEGYYSNNGSMKIGKLLANDANDMPIYKIPIPQNNSMILIQFSNIINPNLGATIQADKRPKLYEVLKQFHIIKNDSVIKFRCTECTNIFVAFYRQNLSDLKEVSFEFTTNILQCNTWHNKLKLWQTERCIIENSSTLQQIHCKCNLETIFSAKTFVMPNRLTLPRDLQLALTDNAIILGCVVILLCVYVLIMLWAWHKDKVDEQNETVVVLSEDSTAHANYEYLITVATGIYRNAGTTAHVKIKLHTTTGTISYLLKAHFFDQGSEKHFLIRTTCSIGIIRKITLSHDSFGRYPSWYCDWVRVRDNQAKEDWIFWVKRWFSHVLKSGGKTNDVGTTATIPLVSRKKYFSKRLLIRKELRVALTDDYLWYSIFVKDAESPFNRRGRATVLLASIAIAMVTNIMFFGHTTTLTIEDEHDLYSKIEITFRIVVFFCESALIKIVLTMLITYCFRCSQDDETLNEEYTIMFLN